MSTEPNSRCREDFERWARSQSMDLSRSIDGMSYFHSETKAAWIGWCAALRDADVIMKHSGGSENRESDTLYVTMNKQEAVLHTSYPQEGDGR